MGRDLEIVKEILRKCFKTVTNWFYQNYSLTFEDICLKIFKVEEILGLIIENKRF